MSTLTIKSSDARAWLSTSLSGVETAGFPATVMRARTCPEPGVVISSARHATGNSPYISGHPRTRLWRRPKLTPRPGPLLASEREPPAAGLGNIAPPSRSRLPVNTLITSTSHEAKVPNSCTQVPIRAYTAARSARLNSRATREIVSASIRQISSTASGVNSAARERTSSSPME